MKYLFTIIGLLGFITLSAQGIDFFEGTWKEAIAHAKKEEKLLFVDAYTTWCGPCKRMSKYVFTDEEVGSFFNKNFINLKLNMEAPDGRAFGKKYPVSAYPTLIFLDGDGKVVKKVKGARQAADLISLAKQAIKDNDKSDKYAALYDEGNRDFDVVYKYVRALNLAGKPSLKIANDYLHSKPDISADQLALFTFESTVEADSRIFDLMLDNKKLILKQVSEVDYKAKVIQACRATISKAIEYDMVMLKEETNDKCLKALGKKQGKLENLKLDMEYFGHLADVKNYLKATDEIVKKYAKKDYTLYKMVVEDIDKRFKDQEKAIQKGIDYGKKLYQKNDSADNAVLYVRMLIHGKEYPKGLEVIDETISKLDAKSSEISKLKSIRKYVESLIANSNS